MKKIIIFLGFLVILSSFANAGFSDFSTNWNDYIKGGGNNRIFDDVTNYVLNGSSASIVNSGDNPLNYGWEQIAGGTGKYDKSGLGSNLGSNGINITSVYLYAYYNGTDVGICFERYTSSSWNCGATRIMYRMGTPDTIDLMTCDPNCGAGKICINDGAIIDITDRTTGVNTTCFVRNSTLSKTQMYIDEQLYYNFSANLSRIGAYSDSTINNQITNVRAWNVTVYGKNLPPSTGDITPPTITYLNCTSCNIPYGDTSAPYETEDTTPTFNFTTNENAWCAVGKTNVNYTTMGPSRNCTSGEGTQSHVCTLTVQDRFNNTGTNYLYISCKDSSGNEGNASDTSKSNSGAIWMEIQGAGEVSGDDAIELGITTSEIGATAIIYTSHRVSARNLANNQFTGVFDKVAVNSNKRWGFNYISANESAITGLFNLTPVLYVLQLQNQTNETITDQVGKLINNTWP